VSYSSKGWAAVPEVSPRRSRYRGSRACGAGSAVARLQQRRGGAFRLCATTPFECSPLFFKPFPVFFSSVEKAVFVSAVDVVCCEAASCVWSHVTTVSKAFFSYLPVLIFRVDSLCESCSVGGDVTRCASSHDD